MVAFLYSHPEYILFVIVNIFIVYRVVKVVFDDNKDDDHSDDDGGIEQPTDPDLDLPPGVSPPRDKELVEY
jgi:hypothetical protein